MEEKKQHLLNDYYYSLEEIAELLREIDRQICILPIPKHWT
jgi:hypothetical protein